MVKNEYRQNYANRPYGMVWRLMAEALYPPGHPYSWTTIGVMEDVEAATRDDVEAFFRRFYVPGNASLAIVGDIDEDRALALAERYFGALPGGTAAADALGARADARPAEVDLTLHDRVELDRRLPGLAHRPPLRRPTTPPLVLLADILGRGKSSRLYRKLVVERELAQDVGGLPVGPRAGRDASASPPPSGPASRWEAARDAGRRRARRDRRARASSEAELDRVKNGRLAGFIYALDNVGGFGGVADRLNAYNIYLGDPGRITSDLDRYQAVTPEAVRRRGRGATWSAGPGSA